MSLLPQWYTSVCVHCIFPLTCDTQVCVCVSKLVWRGKELRGLVFSPIWFGSQCYKIRSRGVRPTCNSNLSVFPWQWIDPTLFTWDKYKFGTDISKATSASAWRTMRLIGIWGSTLIESTLACAGRKMCQKEVLFVQKQIWTSWKAINNYPIWNRLIGTSFRSNSTTNLKPVQTDWDFSTGPWPETFHKLFK